MVALTSPADLQYKAANRQPSATRCHPRSLSMGSSLLFYSLALLTLLYSNPYRVLRALPARCLCAVRLVPTGWALTCLGRRPAETIATS